MGPVRVFCLFFSYLSIGFASAQEAREIVQKADAKVRGSSSQSAVTIQIIRPSWTREMRLKTWTRGKDEVLILVTAPVKDKGIVYLKKGKEVWNWIPSIERNIKLPPSMMSQSWMGTDFTNDDLVKEASMVEDYVHSFIATEFIDGRSCYKIQLLPKPEAAVVWGRVLLWIDKKDLMILHGEYFDESGQLVNTLHAADVRMLGGRLLPARMEMIPADKKGNKTVMIYEDLSFDMSLPEKMFTTQYMPRVQ